MTWPVLVCPVTHRNFNTCRCCRELFKVNIAPPTEHDALQTRLVSMKVCIDSPKFSPQNFLGVLTQISTDHVTRPFFPRQNKKWSGNARLYVPCVATICTNMYHVYRMYYMYRMYHMYVPYMYTICTICSYHVYHMHVYHIYPICTMCTIAICTICSYHMYQLCIATMCSYHMYQLRIPCVPCVPYVPYICT